MPARPSFRRSSLLVGLAVAATSLVATPLTATANPAGTGLVISEVYGGGGNAGATYTNDFIELYNPTASAVDVSGWSVQYRSATGNTAQVTPLTGSIPAGAHYLVQEASTAAVGSPLPTPDATGNISMAGSERRRASGVEPDRVHHSGQPRGGHERRARRRGGLRDHPTSYEGANTGVALANSTSASRTVTTSQPDSDNNAADFSRGPPTAQNSGTTTPPVDPPDPTVTEATIAEIQGTGATSPLVGQNVRTRGVVTASYPTGGLNGFYIQTPGADTANASDAVFVYGGSSGFTTYPTVGDSVEVTGQAAEFSGATQVVADQAGVVPVASLGTVTPKTQVPGTDCALPGTDCLSGAALDEAREVAEGELFQPTAPWTATDVYDGGPDYSDGSNSSSSSARSASRPTATSRSSPRPRSSTPRPRRWSPSARSTTTRTGSSSTTRPA